MLDLHWLGVLSRQAHAGRTDIPDIADDPLGQGCGELLVGGGGDRRHNCVGGRSLLHRLLPLVHLTLVTRYMVTVVMSAIGGGLSDLYSPIALQRGQKLGLGCDGIVDELRERSRRSNGTRARLDNVRCLGREVSETLRRAILEDGTESTPLVPGV